jgi:hypothetical protein
MIEGFSSKPLYEYPSAFSFVPKQDIFPFPRFSPFFGRQGKAA